MGNRDKDNCDRVSRPEEPFRTIDCIRMKDKFSLKDVEDLRTLSRSHPAEPELWDALGDIMQVCDEDLAIGHSIECYNKAIECDASYAPAYESMGWVLDTYFDDFAGAEKNFVLALHHGAGDSARIGLSRVLAQTGRIDAALDNLAHCVDQNRIDVIEMRREIVEGIWFSHDPKMP